LNGGELNCFARVWDSNASSELRVSGAIMLFYGRSDDGWQTLDELRSDNDTSY